MTERDYLFPTAAGACGHLGELMSAWNRPDAMDFAVVMVDLLPHYRALLESYERAQSVQHDGHEAKLDMFEAGQVNTWRPNSQKPWEQRCSRKDRLCSRPSAQ